jgi:hypothetical protein
LARPIILIPYLFRFADTIIFRKDYSPPLVRHLDPSAVPQPFDRIPHAPPGVQARPRLSTLFNHTHEYGARSHLQASNNQWQQGRVRQHDPMCDRRGVHLPRAYGPRLALRVLAPDAESRLGGAHLAQCMAASVTS